MVLGGVLYLKARAQLVFGSSVSDLVFPLLVVEVPALHGLFRTIGVLPTLAQGYLDAAAELVGAGQRYIQAVAESPVAGLPVVVVA